jgi:hypothetical protein
MRTWNYRVIELVTPLNDPSGATDVYRAIHEVHYESDGRPVAYSATPATIGWDPSEGEDAPFAILDQMRTALAKPVLTAQDFQSNGVDLEVPEDLPIQERELFPDERRDVSELKGMFGPAQKVVQIEEMNIGVIGKHGE